jgi:zinc/manganese transport system substrate-binding protein
MILTLLPILAAPSIGRAQLRLQVVATFSILADMARVVGGDDVAVTSLVPPDGDAHVWEPRPADLRALGSAAVLVENGLGLEGWMARMAQASGFHGVHVVAAHDVAPRTMAIGGRPITDPHAWQDPQNALLYVRAIEAGLSQAMPDRAAAIAARAEAYRREIAKADRWITETLAPIPPERRRILTSHDAFGYYGARYTIALRAVQGIGTEGEPSARAIATLIGQIRRENIRAVFVETMTSPRLALLVAKESGAILGPAVYSDALSPPGGPADSYLRMLRHNTTQFAAAMAAN